MTPRRARTAGTNGRQMIGVLRGLLIIALAAIAFEIVFLPRDKHRALDPDEPIAADGSMIAGRARTIYDTNPILRAAGQEARLDPDDPASFEAAIKHDRPWAEGERAYVKALFGPLDWSRCKGPRRQMLINAVLLCHMARAAARKTAFRYAARVPRPRSTAGARSRDRCLRPARFAIGLPAQKRSPSQCLSGIRKNLRRYRRDRALRPASTAQARAIIPAATTGL